MEIFISIDFKLWNTKKKNNWINQLRRINLNTIRSRIIIVEEHFQASRSCARSQATLLDVFTHTQWVSQNFPSTFSFACRRTFGPVWFAVFCPESHSISQCFSVEWSWGIHIHDMSTIHWYFGHIEPETQYGRNNWVTWKEALCPFFVIFPFSKEIF